jgi:hypothetical protein
MAQVVYRSRSEARRASREAMAGELALALKMGAPSVPALEPMPTDEQDWIAAVRAARAYSKRWLKAVEAQLAELQESG